MRISMAARSSRWRTGLLARAGMVRTVIGKTGRKATYLTLSSQLDAVHRLNNIMDNNRGGISKDSKGAESGKG